MVALAPIRDVSSIPVDRLKRFTAEEYNRLTAIGAFTTDDRMELLEGYLVDKMPHYPLHATSLGLLEEVLKELLTKPWMFRTQRPIEVSGDSVPEPDLVIVKGPQRKYFDRHPCAAEVAIVVEVSESTPAIDRGLKRELYASDRIPEYWIVNLIDRAVEVYAKPKGGKTPGYRQMKSFGDGDSVPLRIGATEFGVIAVSELLP